MLAPDAVAELRHDLRTPVNIISGYAEMLLEDAGGGNYADPALVGPLTELGEEMREILRLVTTVLPPSATAVSVSDVLALRTRLRNNRDRVLALLTAAAASPAADQAGVADDLRRMQAAAAQLSGAITDPVDATPRSTEVIPGNVTARADAIAPADILVVDDIEDNRVVLGRRLERLGHRVTTASNGLEALACTKAKPFDLIFLDVMMPGMDGFETLMRLKAREDTRDIPVVMISALDDLTSATHCIAQGAEDYLPKPFDPQILRARVGASLERKRLRDREHDFLVQTMRVIDAARAVEEGSYVSDVLADVGSRSDELGRLARVFDSMACEVRTREARLQQQLRDLRREIDAVRSAAEPPRAPGARVLQTDTNTYAALGIGRVIGGRYEVFEIAGVGGMGSVFRATDLELGGDVALKIVRMDLLENDPALLEWLKREIRLSRRITHANVVRTHDYVEADGLSFITMEYVAGVSLRGLIETRGALAPSACIAMGAQLFRALQAAHEQGVVHRDVKPDNVLLSDDGVLKVMDFGIARLVQATDATSLDGAGTLAYMAPEQILAEPLDARTDLYAAGVVLYEALTGRLPYSETNPMALFSRMMTSPPPDAARFNPDISPALAGLLMALMAVTPDQRPSSARKVELALEGMR